MKKTKKPSLNKTWSKRAEKRKTLVDERLQKAKVERNTKKIMKKSFFQQLIEKVIPVKTAEAPKNTKQKNRQSTLLINLKLKQTIKKTQKVNRRNQLTLKRNRLKK